MSTITRAHLVAVACSLLASGVMAQGLGSFMDGFTRGYSAMSAAQRDQAAAALMNAEADRLRSESASRRELEYASRSATGNADSWLKERAIERWKAARSGWPGLELGRFSSGDDDPYDAFLLTQSAKIIDERSIGIWRLADYSNRDGKSCKSNVMYMEVNCSTNYVQLREAICFYGPKASGQVGPVINVDSDWSPPLKGIAAIIAERACERHADIRWAGAVEEFLLMVEKVEGFRYIDYPIHFKEFDVEIKRIAALPENSSKSGQWILRTAHQAVISRIGRPHP